MESELIELAMKIKISRRRTRLTTYENMELYTTQPIKPDKKKEIKRNIPSNYADFNYYNRMKQRRRVIEEMVYNSFEAGKMVMLTLTFDSRLQSEKKFSDIKTTHKEFKKFIQRVNDHYDNFRYVATFSRQKNGNWHYHMICNFPTTIAPGEVSKLWKNGSFYITQIETNSEMSTVIKYVIGNMNESTAELRGNHGYLCSKAIERDKVITSWREEQEAEYQQAFERLRTEKTKTLYKTKNHLGVRGERVDESTGEIYSVTLRNEKFTNALKNAGYENLDTVYTHLSSAADFSDYFAPLQVATPKPKKFKRDATSKSKK